MEDWETRNVMYLLNKLTRLHWALTMIKENNQLTH